MSKIADFTGTETMTSVESPNLWGPIAGLAWSAFIYLVPQLIVGLLISVYPLLRHWDEVRTKDWLSNAVSAQFIYTLLIEAIAVAIVWTLIKYYKGTWCSIGLVWPRLRDMVYALGGFAAYFIVYAVIVAIVSQLVPAFNVNQQQDIGFHNTTKIIELLMAFVSLVVLPPLAEEVIFRGFLYKGLRRKWSFSIAAIITSTLFAAPHLLEGVSSLLWVGAIDTFVLSIILCYLREKTGRLSAGIGVHALKNGLAFTTLFIFHVH